MGLVAGELDDVPWPVRERGPRPASEASGDRPFRLTPAAPSVPGSIDAVLEDLLGDESECPFPESPGLGCCFFNGDAFHIKLSLLKGM